MQGAAWGGSSGTIGGPTGDDLRKATRGHDGGEALRWRYKGLEAGGSTADEKTPAGDPAEAGRKKIRAGRKPSSVSPVSRGGDHLSGPLVAQRHERSTRKSRTGSPYSLAGSASLCDLAPGGVCQASPVARGPGGLLPHRFTLALAGGLLFCGTFHGVAPCPLSGPPCPLELGLSSPLSGSDHLTRSEL